MVCQARPTVPERVGHRGFGLPRPGPALPPAAAAHTPSLSGSPVRPHDDHGIVPEKAAAAPATRCRPGCLALWLALGDQSTTATGPAVSVSGASARDCGGPDCSSVLQFAPRMIPCR